MITIYELTADDLDTCEIQCQDLKFKLTMGDSDLVFVKISENPIVPTNLEELLRGAVADYDCDGECDLHVFQYHFIPAVLMDYVGETEYASWKNTVSSDYEDFNIVNFIEHFNITKSEFAEMEDEMGTADFYDLEILFDGTETERSNFFLNTK